MQEGMDTNLYLLALFIIFATIAHNNRNDSISFFKEKPCMQLQPVSMI